MQKKSIETILYSSVGIVVMLVILIAVNVLTGAKPLRTDLTQDKSFHTFQRKRHQGYFCSISTPR